MLKVPEKTMLDALEPATHFRPNFDKLIEYCKEQRFPLVVVSGGLGFSIRHFLEQKGWLNKVEIYAPKSTCTNNGITHVLSETIRYYFDQFQRRFGHVP